MKRPPRMAGHALANHRAVEDVESREQGGRAVPDIIVGHCPGPTFFHWQAWLGAVERLSLRLLVDREHEAMGRRVEIQPDHVAQLGGKSWILRQLEVLHPVRLQAVRCPDPLYRAQRHTGGRRHRPAGPVRRLAGRLSERQFDHALDQRRRQRRQSGFSGLLAQQTNNALANEPFLPAPDTRLRHSSTTHDLRRATTFCCRQNDPRPPDSQEGDTPRGPFIYFLNEGHPGTVIEMAEATPVRMRIFDQVREAALNWDGRYPIRMNWPQGK